jgi:molybdenum cofactor synthesis domain-containing protein
MREFEDVRQRGFLRMHSVAEAVQNIRRLRLNPLPIEEIDFRESLNRVCAEDLKSKRDVPPFNRSAVDGYALKAKETFGASVSNPVIFRVIGEVEIGEGTELEVGDGEALRISTGARMPEKANAVVMVEHTSELEGGYIEVYSSLPPWKNVSRIGEDVRKGEIVLRKGEIIQPHHIALLSASGNLRVRVFKKPTVAVASTGNELVSPEMGLETEEVERDKIPDSNRYMLLNLVRQFNAEPLDLGIIPDDDELIRETILRTLERADIIVFSGATSVGKRDLLPEVIDELRDTEFIHGIAIKPGMPAGFSSLRGKPVLLLPGFPVAAYVAFNLLFPRILFSMYGIDFSDFYPPGSVLKALAGARIPSNAGLRTFTRAYLRVESGRLIAYPIRTSGSGILSSLAKAHGIVEVPEEKEGIEEGEEVEIRLINYFLR